MSSFGILAPNQAQKQSPIITDYRHALEQMSQWVASQDDSVQAEKFSDLAHKLQQDRMTIAFCGHFSAGKSTLVNAICGKTLLPSSPIPTSANVVTIVNGEPSAATVFRDSAGTVFPSRAITVEQLHDFAIDGEGVTSIEVSYPIPLLGDRLAIVDTPGVDSTDSAHRAATESALHLADVVFYVTDYNHVQSEVNFRFLRSLAHWGKPTYIIVNQIDKHREEQLTFTSFQESLHAALTNWDIEPAGILYLSLRELEHPLSQWSKLQELFSDLQPLASSLMLRSVERSAVYLAEEYRQRLQLLHTEKRDALQLKLGENGGLEELLSIRNQLVDTLQDIRSTSIRRREQVRTEIDRLLNNANLTPAETREKAKEMLISVQPGFKVGWLSGAAKTEAEKKRRVERFADDFNQQITAHVTGHLKELLRVEAQLAGLEDAKTEQSLEQTFESASPEWLLSKVKSGAGVEGQAILHYTAEISSEWKSCYRKVALQWFDEIQEYRKPEFAEAEAIVESQLAELAQREDAASQLAKLEEDELAKERQLLAFLPEGHEHSTTPLPRPSSITIAQLQSFASLQEAVTEGAAAEGAGLGAVQGGVSSIEGIDVINDEPEVADKSVQLGAPKGAAEKLERAATLLSRVPALQAIADSLSAKAERFRNKSFTIALFGAFSAGKSSFANAIVGKGVLPVSPNPTTATINRILAPYDEHKDGSALITMKTLDLFLEDIRHSLKRIGISQEDLLSAGSDAERLLALREPITANELHPKGRPHLTFLHAASRGWEHYGALLGTQFTVLEEEYRRYAAEEQASCFVAEIDLFVDSPITRSGAVLVDTPGADSINARHTGVAFQYIKNADAVLFVTYYNHAFTEADREFLNQLGSVKDVFELDKMFFIINAADLASSDDELASVKTHVRTQLQKHGIRNPRLFAVSSLQGLHAKQLNRRQELDNSGVAAFEQAFHSFSEDELGGLALASANKELDRVDRLLESWLQSANEDASTREAKAARLQAQAEHWRTQGAEDLPTAVVQPLIQEISEQLYHLRQRLRFRFKDHVQSAFHPSVLQDDGRDLKKMLQACAEDLKRSLAGDLMQELRAAGLRLEGTVNDMMVKALDTMSGIRELAQEGFSPEPAERYVLELPLPEFFTDGPQLDSKRLWSLFRSPKHFFEKEGAVTLREELHVMLFAAIDEELSRVSERWEQSATSALLISIQNGAYGWAEQLAAFAISMSDNLREPGEERILSELQEQWRIIKQ